MSNMLEPTVPNSVPAVAVAPVATPVIPEAPALPKRTYASPMSYVGSGRRTTAWIRKVGNSSPIAAGLAWTAGVLWLTLMWVVILPAYLFVTLVIFGWFMIPFRLIRRSGRKQQHLQEAQLATMQQMMVAQQQQICIDCEALFVGFVDCSKLIRLDSENL